MGQVGKQNFPVCLHPLLRFADGLGVLFARLEFLLLGWCDGVEQNTVVRLAPYRGSGVRIQFVLVIEPLKTTDANIFEPVTPIKMLSVGKQGQP